MPPKNTVMSPGLENSPKRSVPQPTATSITAKPKCERNVVAPSIVATARTMRIALSRYDSLTCR